MYTYSYIYILLTIYLPMPLFSARLATAHAISTPSSINYIKWLNIYIHTLDNILTRAPFQRATCHSRGNFYSLLNWPYDVTICTHTYSYICILLKNSVPMPFFSARLATAHENSRNPTRFSIGYIKWLYIHTAQSRNDETRNGHWNTNRNPEWSSQGSF